MLIPPVNYILFKPFWDAHVAKHGEYKFFVDTSYDVGEHQPVHGTVVAVPDRLDYEHSDLLDWDTEMELQAGDEVVCDFFDVFCALNELPHRWLEVDGEKMLMIRYDRVLAARRGEEIIPLNGYIFCSAIKPEDLSPLERVEWRKVKHDKRFGKVEYVGKRLKGYRYPPVSADDYDLNVGSVVAWDKACDIPVEHPLHKNFFKETMFRVHRRDIIGIII
jgi:hypothetical protein